LYRLFAEPKRQSEALEAAYPGFVKALYRGIKSHPEVGGYPGVFQQLCSTADNHGALLAHYGAVEISLEPQVITLAVLVLELTLEPWKLNLKLRGLLWSHIGFP
jgi:hypothetical protein